jgi:PAS domain S-box-containing protein
MDYKKVVNSLNTLISVNSINSKLRFREVNEKAFSNVLGYKRADLINQSILEFVDHDGATKLKELIKKRDQSKTNSLELRVKGKNDKYHWFEVEVKPYKIESYETVALIVMQPISKRKKIETQLKETENLLKQYTEEIPEIQFWKIFTPKKIDTTLKKTLKMFQKVINNIPQKIFWKDENLKYLGCNTSYANFLGFNDPNNIIGKKDNDIFQNEDLIDQLRKEESKIIESGSSQYHSIEELEIDNENRILNINRVPLRFEKNKIQGLLITYEDITERENTKQKLKKEQDLLQRIMETSPSGIVWVNKEGRLTFANSRAQEVLRLERDELQNRYYNDKKWKITDLEGNNFPNSQLPFHIVSKTLEPVYNVKHAIQSLEGELISLEINASPLFDEDNNFDGMVATVRDISEELERKRKLRESEKKYRDLVDLLPEVIYEADLDFNLTYVNSIGFKKFLYTPEDFEKGLNVIQMIAPECRDMVKKRIEKIFKGKVTDPFDYKMLRKDGTTFYGRIHSRPIYDETGEINGIRGIIHDVTEKKIAIQRLNESEKKYRHLFESSPFFIGLFNLRGNLIDCNKAFNHFLSTHEKEELIGKSFSQILTNNPQNKELVPKFNKIIETLRSGERKEIVGEFSYNRTKGGRVWVNFYSSLIQSGEKKLIQTILQDITERKRAEIELKESEEKFRKLTEQSLMGIGIMQDNKFQYVNKRLAEIVNYSPEEILGWEEYEYLKFIHPEFQEKVKIQAEKKQKGHKDVDNHYELKVITKDSKVKWIELFSISIYYNGKWADFITALDITEKKESEKKYRYLFEKSPNMICVLDTEGVIIDVNNAFVEFMQLNKEAYIGYKIFKTPFFNLEETPIIKQKFSEISSKNSIKSFELQLKIPDKGESWLRIEASKIESEFKDLIIAIMEDITDQKNFERMLMLNEKRLNSLQKINQMVDEPETLIVNETLKAALDLTNSKIASLILRKERNKDYHLYHVDVPYKKEKIIKKKINDLNVDSPLVDSIKQRKTVIINKNLESHDTLLFKDNIKEQIKRYIIVPVVESNEGVCSLYLANKRRNYTELDVNQTSLLMDGFWKNVQRKRAKLALKQSEENYKNLLETSSVGVIEVDQESQKITYMNPKIQQITGLDGQVMNKMDDFIKLIHPEDLHKYQNNPDASTFEFRIIDKKKEIKWISGTKINNYSEEGKLESFRMWIQDVTEQKLYENLVYELNVSFLKFSTDIKKNMIMLLETCKNLMNAEISIYVNRKNSGEQQKYKILTSSGDELIYSKEEFQENLYINQFYAEAHDFPQIHKDIDQTKFKGTDPFLQNYEIKSCYGKLIRSKGNFNNCLCIFFNRNRKTSHKKFLVLFLISDALEIENNRWNMQQHLEKQNKMLEEMNMLKSDLLSRTSHELKTPLISIKGFTELLLTVHKPKFDAETISILEEIKKGSGRLEEIINTLLKSSKLDRDGLELNTKKEDLSFLIKFTVNELKGLANMRDQNINVEIHESLETKFDKERIHEVLSNLIVNAIKYTPPGGDITIKTEKKENEYRVSVSDTGVGFTKQEKSVLFTQFGKIERYGKGWDLGIEGSGLGLYIAKKIVELHEGKIWAHSEGRNKGSTFSFTLPIK